MTDPVSSSRSSQTCWSVPFYWGIETIDESYQEYCLLTPVILLLSSFVFSLPDIMVWVSYFFFGVVSLFRLNFPSSAFRRAGFVGR